MNLHDRFLALAERYRWVVFALLLVGAVDAGYRLWDGTSLLYSIPDPRDDLLGFGLVLLVVAVLIALLYYAIGIVIARMESQKYASKQ